MYQRFLLILAVCGLPMGLYPHDPSVDQEALLPAQEAATLNDLGMYEEEPMYDELLSQAYEVRRGLLCKPEYNQPLIKRLDAMINDLATQENEEVIKSYGYHLRRYEKLSRLCASEKFNEKKYLEIRQLIEEREKLVKKILSHYVTLAFAQKTQSELPTLTRQPLSAKRKAQYEQEFQNICTREYTAIQKIQEQLFPIEKKLLADHRTFGEKYGLVLTVAGVGVAFFGTILITASLIHSKFSKKAADEATAKTPKARKA